MEKEYVYNNKVCKRTIKGTFVRNRDAVRAEIKEIPTHQLFNYKCSILINSIKGKLSQNKIIVSDSCVYRYIREEKAARSANTTNESQSNESQSDEN